MDSPYYLERVSTPSRDGNGWAHELYRRPASGDRLAVFHDPNLAYFVVTLLNEHVRRVAEEKASA